MPAVRYWTAKKALMQKDSLILALFILAVVICLGLTFVPKLADFVQGTAKSIRVEQVVKL